MKRITFCFTLFALFAIKINGQNIQEKQIDSFIVKSLQEFKEIPSISITVVKDGKPFYAKNYGHSNLESKIKASNETSYYIASVTKSFVGLLAAKLESDGVLNLDDPITNYKPIKNFKNKSLIENISIKDLLSHSSGIKNNALTSKYASIGNYNTSSMVKLLENKTSSLNNNKKFRYDNFGYNVFDLILSEEFNILWKKLLEKEIFSPLKMKHTSAYISSAKKGQWNLAMPYASINDDRLPKMVLTKKNNETFQAAGGIISSIDDMQNILLMYMNNGYVDGVKVFNDKVLSRSLTLMAKNKKKGTISILLYMD